MTMKQLYAYMKQRAAFEGVEWKLTVTFLQKQFDLGIRTFFGVDVDDQGNLLRDIQQPEFFAKRAGDSTKKSDKKVMRLAHKILTKTFLPAKLSLEETVDVAITLVKAIVIAHTDDDDPDDRAEMIEWIEERFLNEMHVLNPNADHMHVWLVPPQGLITEPAGFLWSGDVDDGVDVLIGTELEALRTDLPPTGVIVTEGVDGIAMTDPEWDGESTVTCANPQCGKEHDAHLRCAENLFQQAKEGRIVPALSN
jgi:hypothetical protein